VVPGERIALDLGRPDNAAMSPSKTVKITSG
jgi:hypothetical protein